MDYGIEVPSYRRVDNEKERKKLNDLYLESYK